MVYENCLGVYIVILCWHLDWNESANIMEMLRGTNKDILATHQNYTVGIHSGCKLQAALFNKLGVYAFP